jgi:resuscitation-promoting factor RpfB
MNQRSTSKKQTHRLHNWHKHPLVLPVAVFLVMFFASLVAMVVSGANTLGATDARVVSITVNGEQQSLPTRARTVGELLERLEIQVGEKDIIEPSVDTEIRENDFRINYYQARTVVIVDGEREEVLETAAPTPREVVQKAGIEVYPEDIVEKDGTELTDALDVLTDGVVADRIVVQRSVPVNVNLFGQTYELRTHAKTIAELVEEQGIKLSDASVFPAPTERIVADQAIFVTDAGRQIVTEEEPIAQAEETVDDFDLTLGRRGFVKRVALAAEWLCMTLVLMVRERCSKM